MAFVRILNTLLRDKEIGKRIVPIVPDESRTFGMEGMFRQFGIFSQVGQLYRPQDADQMMFYREDKTGQILQEGINEAGAMASWIAAATSYSTSNTPVIPFYIYYSMFGFQRVGDLAWAAGDMRARGFLIGGTSGRTTLNGEGLQHEDGHSHLIAATIPNCVCYDPTYSYELAVIVQDGLRRMYGENEDVFYYITTLNENYPHGEMPEGAEEGIRKGMYKLRSVEAKKKAARVQLLGSGAILREVEAGAALLADDFGIASDIWSVTSFMELRRDGLDARSLEHAAPDRDAQALSCRDLSRQGRRSRHCVDRLHEAARRPDPAVRSRPLSCAGDRWLWPFRLQAKTAQLLRGRSLPCRRRRVEGAVRRRNGPGFGRCRRAPQIRHRSRQAKSGNGLRSVTLVLLIRKLPQAKASRMRVQGRLI